MSSPFNPLSALTPAPGLTPHPLAVAESPHFSPGTPWLQLLTAPTGTGATPGAISLPPVPGMTPVAGPGPGPVPGQGPAPAPGAGPGSLSLPAAGPSAQAASDADETVRAIPEISRFVERAEAVRAEITALEKNIFVTGEGAERAGTLSRLEALQLDYAQTLFALIQLSSTYLVGALPVNLSAVAGEPAGGAGSTANTAGAAPATSAPPSSAELAAWTEARAQTMFARREAVRNASKAVGDVLKGGR